MTVCTQNYIHVVIFFFAKYKMKVGLETLHTKNWYSWGLYMQYFFGKKRAENVQYPFISVLNKYQIRSSQGISLTCLCKQKLETSIDFHQQAPSAQTHFLSSPHWQHPFQDWGFLISISFGACLPRHGQPFKFIFVSHYIIFYISCIKNKLVRRYLKGKPNTFVTLNQGFLSILKKF